MKHCKHVVYVGSKPLGVQLDLPLRTRFERGVPVGIHSAQASKIPRGEFETYNPDNPAHRKPGKPILIIMPGNMIEVCAAIQTVKALLEQYPTKSFTALLTNAKMHDLFDIFEVDRKRVEVVATYTPVHRKYWKELRIQLQREQSYFTTQYQGHTLEFCFANVVKTIAPAAQKPPIHLESARDRPGVLIGPSHFDATSDELFAALKALVPDAYVIKPDDDYATCAALLHDAKWLIAVGNGSISPISVRLGVPTFEFRPPTVDSKAKQHVCQMMYFNQTLKDVYRYSPLPAVAEVADVAQKVVDLMVHGKAPAAKARAKVVVPSLKEKVNEARKIAQRSANRSPKA